MTVRTLKIRPYARLLTMLGEQLIRNEQIALSELIKNSYDADADWVKVNFVDLKIESNPEIIDQPVNSRIVVEDNGCGMTWDVIEKSWMNPATPNKKSKTNEDVKKTPNKGRVIQGEKGIGRFAILKLGRNILITTRPKWSDKEYVIHYDLSQYDDDFLSENGDDKELFIDDINIKVEEREPITFIEREIIVNNKRYKGNNYGTKIEISNLKGSWNFVKIQSVSNEIQKLESIFDKIFNRRNASEFEIGFEINNKSLSLSDSIIEKLTSLLEKSSVLKITDGEYHEKGQFFTYKLNGTPQKLLLKDPQIVGLNVFKDYFAQEKDLFGNLEIKNTQCGDFKFNFFVFDFIADKESQYYLDKNDKILIKEHRIYLYRDHIRVAPYGDPDNDWLETDKKRATGRTGDYLSNDQVVGFVDITKQNNPRLKDKTNREGLIEEGTATRDFTMLLHSILLFIRQHPYQQYQFQVKQAREQEINKLRIVDSKFDDLKNNLLGNNKALSIYNDLVKSYKIEQEFYKRRLENTEDLAGVGLSVETSSHDMMMMLSKGIDGIDNLVKKVDGGLQNEEQIEKELITIRDIFSFVQSQMKDIQLLFKSSKQRRREIRFSDLLEKVEKIYRRSLARENIVYSVEKKGPPIVIECTDAVILQLLINLFDNAIYWLSTSNITHKRITITLDGSNQRVFFSDNGPGIKLDDKPYIFEAFYSGKEEGRGLGLYIARQLLKRMGYSIDLSDVESEKILSGANFVINFLKEGNND